MVNYTSLLESIDELYYKECKPEYVKSPDIFPDRYKNIGAFKGQPEAIDDLIKLDDTLLSSHTGSGKTLVFLAASHLMKTPTLVIEPRKFLQEQVAMYYNDVMIYGRTHYKCRYANDASKAPCSLKSIDDDGKTIFYHYDAKKDILESHLYPCQGCEYIKAKMIAQQSLAGGGVVICNFGNFWSYLKSAHLVIIDEADLFFKSVTNAIKMKTIKSLKENVKDTLDEELQNINVDLEHIEALIKNIKLNDKDNYIQSAKRYEDLKNKREKINFYLEHHDMCFQYSHTSSKTKETEFFVEMNPKYIDVLKRKLFSNKRLIVVTATPSDFNSKNVINYSVPQRTRIFYAPIGNLTRTNVFTRNNQHLIKDLADFILTMQSVFSAKYDTNKILIHTGNISGHAYELMKHLPIERCVLHERGKLLETIERFKTDSFKNILLVVGAEYGLDIGDINLQFIAKIPYQDFNSRIREIQKTMSKKDFDEWYSVDALNRLIQSAGRAGRGANAFGVTIICDSKFKELYFKYKQNFPKWFEEKLDSCVY